LKGTCFHKHYFEFSFPCHHRSSFQVWKWNIAVSKGILRVLPNARYTFLKLPKCKKRKCTSEKKKND
jgi:hypothetical protein